MCLFGIGVVDRGVLNISAGVVGGGVGECRRGLWCCWTTTVAMLLRLLVDRFVPGRADELLAGQASNGRSANWREVVLAPNRCLSLSYGH